MSLLTNSIVCFSADAVQLGIFTKDQVKLLAEDYVTAILICLHNN